MARANQELSNVIKAYNSVFNNTGQTIIQDYLRKNSGRLFLLPLKQRLYQKGISGDGTKLPPYAPKTILLKKAKGIRSTPTTLFYSGDWYDSLYVHFGFIGKRHVIEVLSRDSIKTPYLKKKYGAAILQLTDEEAQVVLGAVETFITNKMRENLFDLNINFTK
jgi:hypothetical protein